MKALNVSNCIAAAVVGLLGAAVAHAEVSADEAAHLKTTLTPLGAERAANRDGSIPAWTGAPTPGSAMLANGRRPDPFAAEKPLFSVSMKNMPQYADQLTEGTKALMKKYPETFRIDVYKTHRTAMAPQWVYENTAKNATQAKLVEGGGGPQPQGAYAGIPFPIPKSGVEVMWNHLLRWRGEAGRSDGMGYQLTQDGQWVNIIDVSNDFQLPYYKQGAADKFNNEYWLVRSLTKGPAIRAGEAVVGRLNLDESKSSSWVYLTGQRRVRKLPNPCCDTPAPFSSGVSAFDEVSVFTGRLDRFDWKIVGKKEMFIPYNANRSLQPKDSELLKDRHLNPDYIRWELHRVWVVDATLKPGQRHTSPKNRYYVDEDTWAAVTADRYDSRGDLTRVPIALPIVMSDVPATELVTWGIYDLSSGSSFFNSIPNERNAQYKIMPAFKDSAFTPDAMAGEGLR